MGFPRSGNRPGVLRRVRRVIEGREPRSRGFSLFGLSPVFAWLKPGVEKPREQVCRAALVPTLRVGTDVFRRSAARGRGARATERRARRFPRRAWEPERQTTGSNL